MDVLTRFLNEANAAFWVGIFISFLLGYLTNVVSGPHQKRYMDWVGSQPIRRVLGLGNDDVIVVIPHRRTDGNRKLPTVAVEDVLALRNVFELLAEVGIRKPKIRHPENLAEPDRKKNIITIGGSTRNEFTKYILSYPVNADEIKFSPSVRDPDQTELKRGSTAAYLSPSYSSSQTEGVTGRTQDMAVLLRRPNPRNASNSVVVIAGIRGIGTWGASDCLRKQAEALAHNLKSNGNSRLPAGFLALVEVDYENFDILRTRVKDFACIKEES